jgi:uncharacterized protein with HEPN domain
VKLDDSAILADVAEFAGIAAEIVARGHDHFEADNADGAIVRLAAHMLVINLSAAVGQFSADFQAAHPDVRWGSIRGMRHRLAHTYRGVNEALVWEVMQRDIPALVAQLGR